MKTCLLIFSMFIGQHAIAQAIEKRYGMFDGRTPCQELSLYLQEKPRPECIKIKWRLFLYKDAVTNEPTRYELSGFIFKRDKPQTGKWNIIKGTAGDPAATVYELVIAGKPSLLFLKADENILIFLDAERKPYVGNRDFSFALNRVR